MGLVKGIIDGTFLVNSCFFSVYKMKYPTAVDFNPIELAQFLLSSHQNLTVTTAQAKRRTRINTGVNGTSFRNDSIVIVRFYFDRQTGFFMLQIYTPLMLIVVCSWVTFWLVKTDKGGEVPARTALGANAVLSVVNIGFGGESRPEVNNSSDFVFSVLRHVFCDVTFKQTSYIYS